MSNQLTPIALMAKADRACLSARALFNLGDVDGACNRAYYAMFDAARAALLASGAPVRPDIGKTHSGLINAFSEHLIKNGPISKELGRLLKRAEEIRLVADYKGDSVELSDAQEMVTQAETEVEVDPISRTLSNRKEESEMPKTKPPYTPGFRQQMVELVRSGRKPSELSKEFGCHTTSILSWVRQAGGSDASALPPANATALNAQERQELIELRRKLRQVQIERDILAKATAWFAAKSDKTFTPSTHS